MEENIVHEVTACDDNLIETKQKCSITLLCQFFLLESVYNFIQKYSTMFFNTRRQKCSIKHISKPNFQMEKLIQPFFIITTVL